MWGFLKGPQQGLYDFRFDLPVHCAAAVESGDAAIGLVPSAEVERMGLDFYPGLGIATEGPVRSILLVSRVPFREIRTLAADSSSRTSVALTRIMLRERYGCTPAIRAESPVLEDMLEDSDAALVIGDPALRLDPAALPYFVMDLGAEWVAWTELPMVFAVWAGRQPVNGTAFEAAFAWGGTRIEEMVAAAAAERGFAPGLAREYLTRNIVYRLGPKHLEGLALFRRLSSSQGML